MGSTCRLVPDEDFCVPVQPSHALQEGPPHVISQEMESFDRTFGWRTRQLAQEGMVLFERLEAWLALGPHLGVRLRFVTAVVIEDTTSAVARGEQRTPPADGSATQRASATRAA